MELFVFISVVAVVDGMMVVETGELLLLLLLDCVGGGGVRVTKNPLLYKELLLIAGDVAKLVIL